MNLSSHSWSDCNHDIIVNPDLFPYLQVGDVVCVYHPSPSLAQQQYHHAHAQQSLQDQQQQQQQQQQASLQQQQQMQQQQMIFQQQQQQYLNQQQQGSGQRSGDDADNESKYRLILVITTMNKMRGRYQVSICNEIMNSSLFQLRKYQPIIVEKVSRDIKAVAVSGSYQQRHQQQASLREIFIPAFARSGYVEFFFKDAFVSQSRFWRFRRALRGQAVYIGKTISFGGVNFRVDDILSEQNSQSTLSGVVTETTKLIFRSGSARIYWLIQISKEMWDFIEEDGDLFHERLINKFLPEVIDRWTRKNVKHMLTVVFFSRTFFDKVPESYSNTSSSGNIFHRDYNDRYYVDFYRVALQNVDFSSHPGGWRAIIPILKKEISMFPAYCGWDFGSPWMKNPEGNENVVNGMNNPATIATGISGPDAPKGIASSAQEGNVLEAINLALNILDKHYIDRELSITGQAVVLITPGPGVFEVDRDLTNITKLRMMDNSIGCDVVSLAKAPLHVAPLFIFKPRYPLPEGDKPDLLDQPHPFAPRSTYFLDSDLVDIPSEGSKNLSDYPKRSSKQEVNQRKPVYNVPYWIHLSFPYVKPAKRRNVTEIVLPRPPLTPGFYAPSSRIAVKYIESSLVLQAEMRNFGTNPDKTTIWRERFEPLPEHQFACKLILSSDDYIRVTSEPVIPHIASLTLSSSGQNLSSSFSTHSLPIESQTSQQTNNSNNTNQTNVSSSNSNTTNNNNNINGNNNNSAVAVVKEEKKKNLTFAVKNASKASLSAPLSKSRTSMMNLRSINQSSSKLGSGFIQDSYLHSNSHVNVSHQVSMEMHEIMKDANLIRDEQLYHDKRVFSSQTSYMASPSRQYMERPEGETATLLNLPQSAIGMGNQSTIQDVTASPRRLSFSTSHSDMRHEKQLASKALQGLDQQSLTRISSLSSSIRINSTEPQSVSHSRMQPQPSSSYSETPSALKILHARSKASGNDFTLGTLSDGEKEGEHELNMNQLSSDEESSTKHLPFKPVNLDKGAHYMNRSVSTANIESSTRFHQEKEPNSFPVPENIKSNPHSFHTSPSAKNDDPNTYINPFNSKKIQSDLNRLSYNRSRWAHLFPQGKFQDRNDGKDPVGEVIPITIESYRPNWKSLTSPGIVPLTTEFEPQEADLKRDYTEKVYSLVPPKGCTEQQALNEIVELRFAQDFQLIVRPKPAPIYHEQQTSTQIATNNQAISINGTAATNPSFIHQTQTSQTPSSTSFENTSNVLKRFQPRPTQSLQGIEPVKSMERKISTSVNHPNKGIIGSKGTGTKSLKSDGDLATYELTMGHTIHCISHSDGHIYVKSFVQKNSKSKFRSSDWNYSYLLWDSLLNVAAPVHHSHKPNLINYKWNSLDNAIIEAQNFEDKGPYQVPYRRQNYSIIPIQLPLNLSLNDLAPSNTNLSNPNQDNVDGLRTEQEKKMFNGFLSFVKWISTRLQSTNSLTVKQYAKMLQLDVLKDGGKSNDEDDNNFVLVKVALVASKREAHAHHGEGAKKDGANEQKKDESKDAVNKEEGSNLGDKTVTSGSNDRTEWLILRLDKVFSPYKCFHMEVQWMLASGIRVAEFVSQMINFTQKFGLSLKQTPEYCRSLTPGYNEHGAGRIPHPFVIPRSLTDATNPMLSDNRFHALLVGMLLREEAGFLIDDVIAKKNVPVSPSSLISPTVAVSGVTNGSLTMTAPIASTTNPVLRRSRSQQIESKDEVKEWQQLRVSTMVHRDGIAFISLNEGITFVPNYRVLTPTKQSEEEQKIRSLLFQAINYVAIAEATFEFVDSIFSSAGLN